MRIGACCSKVLIGLGDGEQFKSALSQAATSATALKKKNNKTVMVTVLWWLLVNFKSINTMKSAWYLKSSATGIYIGHSAKESFGSAKLDFRNNYSMCLPVFICSENLI